MAEIDVTRIAGNIGAMNALNALKGINTKLSVHQTRLSTGKRINTAADDPAGLSIATRMLSRSEGLKVALANIGDAKNLLAVAESGMGRINDILVQMRNKAESAASDTMGADERTAIKTQLEAYAAQINDIAEQTKWNDTKLLGGFSEPMRLQTGVDAEDYTNLSSLGDMHATSSLLSIANAAATSSVTDTDGVADTKVAMSFDGTAAGIFDHIGELSTGSYTLEYSYVASTKALTFQLKDAVTGQALSVDSDGVAGTTFESTGPVTITKDLTTGGTVKLGNGVSLAFSASAVDIAATQHDFAYTKQGTLALNLGVAEKAADYAAYMSVIETAIKSVNSQMSSLGAITGRLTFKEDQVSAAQINVEAAYNRIMNADMAEEQVEASKYQILQQTATAMLAQANAAPQFLLSLFR